MSAVNRRWISTALRPTVLIETLISTWRTFLRTNTWSRRKHVTLYMRQKVHCIAVFETKRVFVLSRNILRVFDNYIRNSILTIRMNLSHMNTQTVNAHCVCCSLKFTMRCRSTAAPSGPGADASADIYLDRQLRWHKRNWVSYNSVCLFHQYLLNVIYMWYNI